MLLVGLTLIPTMSVFAKPPSEALSVELERLADDIHQVLEKRDLKIVAIGSFSSAASVSGSSGPELQLKLQRALEVRKVVIRTSDYQAEVQGHYVPSVDAESKVQGVKITARLVDGDGTTLSEFPSRFIFGQEVVPRLLGLTVQTPPMANDHARSDAFKQALDNQKSKTPSHHTAGTRVTAGAGSPFGIELLAKRSGQYRAQSVTTGERGLPFVELKRDDIYAIRLSNQADHDAAVKVTIDGLNVFAFSDTAADATYWLVPKKSSLTVQGWHKNNKTSVEFKVIDFPATAAAKLNFKPSETVGTISASFAAAWTGDADKPADERSNRGTGFGDDIVVETRRVERILGNTRAVISLRYER